MSARAENSNSKSSTARTTAARVPRMWRTCRRRHQASRIFRSEGDTRSSWPVSEPMAPPVTMIGPSAPNGADEPMATAAEIGLAIAVDGAIRLSLVSTASIASGMPVAADDRCPLGEAADDEGADHGDDHDAGLGAASKGGWNPERPNTARFVMSRRSGAAGSMLHRRCGQPGSDRPEQHHALGRLRTIHRPTMGSEHDMNPVDRPSGDRELETADFEALLGRDGLRRFLRWSEECAKAANITVTASAPPCHQGIAAPRACPTCPGRHLLLRHHSAVELVDRARATRSGGACWR